MALPFVFLSKNLRYKSPKASLHRCLTNWLDYSDNKVVISFSLTEVKWAESLKNTLKEALVLFLCFSIDSDTKTDVFFVTCHTVSKWL